MSVRLVVRSVLVWLTVSALLLLFAHYAVHASWQRAAVTAPLTVLLGVGVPLLLAGLALRQRRRSGRDDEGGSAR